MRLRGGRRGGRCRRGASPSRGGLRHASSGGCGGEFHGAAEFLEEELADEAGEALAAAGGELHGVVDEFRREGYARVPRPVVWWYGFSSHG